MAKKRRIKKKKIVQLVALLLIVIGILILLFQLLFKKDFQVQLETKESNIGQTLQPKFKATWKGQDVTNEVKFETDANVEKEGSYPVTFIYQKDQKEYKVKIKIKITDVENPLITLIRGNEITVLKGETFKEPGYSAIDKVDGDLTSNVKVSGTVDMTKEGEYTLTYTVADKKKNVATVTRKVKVSATSPLNMSVEDFTLEGLFSDVTLSKTEDALQKYIDETIFAGDSMPLYYVINKQIKGTQLWHRQSIDPETALTNTIYINHQESGLTFVQAFTKYKPKRVILTLGTNSAAFMEPEYFAQKYTELVKQLKEASPDTELIIQSIPPVAKKLDSNNGITNKKINVLNYYIAEMCSSLNVKFLNSAVAMKDSDGTCKAGYCLADDGIHPTEAGNVKLIEYAKNHAYQK